MLGGGDGGVVQSHFHFKPNFLGLGQVLLRLSLGCDKNIFSRNQVDLISAFEF